MSYRSLRNITSRLRPRLVSRPFCSTPICHDTKLYYLEPDNVLLSNPSILYDLPRSRPLKSVVSFSPDPSALPLGLVQQSSRQNTDSSNQPSTSPTTSPSDFVQSPQFINILQKVLSHHIYNCPVFVPLAAADFFNNGEFFHIYDLRNPPPYGRIPEVQDILGTVRLEAPGTIVPGSYEPNAMYRVLTTDGFVSLSDYLSDKVRQECEKVTQSD